MLKTSYATNNALEGKQAGGTKGTKRPWEQQRHFTDPAVAMAGAAMAVQHSEKEGSQVLQQLANLEAVVNDIENLMGELKIKLSPVLRPGIPDEGTAGSQSMPMAPLAINLQNVVERLSAQQLALLILLKNVEL